MKKLIPLLLVITLLFGLIPTAAIPVSAASGSCGNGVTWTLDNNGTLTISGNGRISDVSASPWKSYADRITAIVIQPGVTAIGSHAFYELGAVKSATIPNTVTSIGEAAFCWCESLTAIDIPGSVTFIGEDAFWCCLDLKDVTFHEGLKTIDREAFQGCRLITELHLPESLTSIGYWAFGSCDDLQSVNLPAGVTVLEDSVFSGCISLKTVTLHEGLTSISNSSFAYCFALQNIAIPGSVQSIGDTAFYLCEQLGTVTFNGAPPVISDTAFAGAVATIRYPAPVTAWADCVGLSYSGALTWQSYSVDGHTYVDTIVPPTCLYRGYTRHVCSDCGETYMDSYIDPLDHKWDGGVTSGSRTTYTCTRCGLKRYEYNVSGTCGNNARWTLDTEAGILHITGTGAISVGSGYSLPWKSYVSGIRHVVIDEGITAIGAETFYECEFIETIDIPDTVNSIGYNAFVWCSSLKELVIPEGVTVIRESTFWGCESLESLILPSTLTTIETDCFYKCGSLKSLTLPDGVTSIAESAFWYCDGLEEITIPSSLTAIENNTFSTCLNLRTVHLPDTLTSIGDSAFSSCYKLQSVTIPGSVESLGRAAFYGCSSLTSIRFTGNPPAFHEEAFLGINATVYYPFVNRTAWEDAKQQYGGSAYWLYYLVTGHNYATTVVAPTCLHRGYTKHACTDVGCNTYYMDTYTDPLDHAWNEGTGTTTQWTYTCTRCGDTRTVYNVTGSCGNSVYWSLNTESGMLRIYGTGAMSNYSRTPPWNSYKDSIRHVIVEEGVTSIGSYAFYEHAALLTAELPSSLRTLGLASFCWCENLQAIHIPEGVTSIPEDCFWACLSMTELTLPSTLRSIGQGAFYSNEKLTTLDLPAGLTFIDEDAFWECESITSVVIPEGVTSIPDVCFAGCTNLRSVTLHDNITTLGRDAFNDCVNLRSLILPKKLKTIGINALADIGVTSLTIPANVTSIDIGAFYGADLSSIHFQGDAPTFDAKALQGISIVAYYPRDNATWTDEVRQNYGGSVVWVAEAPCSHRYDAAVTAPTCGTQGYTDYTCANCGYYYRGDYVDATGIHVMSDWITEWEPTCEHEGYISRYCIHCGGEYECITLPMLEHDYYSYVTPPTCYSNGYTEYWCNWCGLYYLDDYTDLIDHEYSSWEEVYPPTCTEEGVEYHYCSMCGWEESRNTPVTGHTYDDAEDALCNVCGAERTPSLRGDADGNGRVNNRDLGLLQRCLNGWSVTVDTIAADLNTDGKLNNHDLALLQRLLNGWEVAE